MPTPLHDPDVWRDLADGPPGPARDWANARLALVSPGEVAHLPDDSWDAAVCLACPVPSAADHVLGALAAGDQPTYAALLVDQLFTFGGMPGDAGPWIDPLRAAVDDQGHERNLWLGRALADLGALDGDTLAACARVTADEALAAMPALVLRFTAARDGDLAGIAAHVAGPLGAAMADAPHLLLDALAHLGVAPLELSAAEGLAGSASAGARAGGGQPPSLPDTRGSRRRRSQAIVQHVLAEHRSAAGALLGALAATDHPQLADLVGHAAWLAAFDPDEDAVPSVISHGGGEDRARLAAARRDVRAEHAPRLAASLRDGVWASTPAVALAGELLVGAAPDPSLVVAIRDRSLLGRGTDRRIDVLASVALARDPDRVAEMIASRATRDAGLLFARYAQTEEVLHALLELAVPADPAPRFLYAWALAEMADPAAEAPLAALLAYDDAPGVVKAARRAEALLGRPLSTG